MKIGPKTKQVLLEILRIAIAVIAGLGGSQVQ